MDKYEKYKNENKGHYIQRLDSESDIKRKYKLIIEEVYKYETDSPFDIARVIDGYVNYT